MPDDFMHLLNTLRGEGGERLEQAAGGRSDEEDWDDEDDDDDDGDIEVIYVRD
jgi:23S rRNA pseudouridine1911/1915/1917 synthase